MKNTILFLSLFIGLFFLEACSSSEEDDVNCIKTITIKQFYIVNNQTFSYDINQEVPCDFPVPETPVQIEPVGLEGFSYEVLSFDFTPNTGNNTSRLQFEIKLNNPNDYAVSGISVLTLDIDGIVSKSNFSDKASTPCYELAANSSCVLTYSEETSLDLGLIDAIELVEVEYFVTE